MPSTKVNASSSLVKASLLGQSLLDTSALSADEIVSLFHHAEDLSSPQNSTRNSVQATKVICCLFFEPSTRTRMSFQMAAYRLGHQVLTMELSSGSSLSKGETYEDTVLNIVAMKPDALVIRYGDSGELDNLLPNLPVPVLNAGSGTAAHPTQALLDAFTIYRERGPVSGQRVLIVGDLLHSRVARSNFDVLRKLGAEIGICGPESLLPRELPGVQVFPDLDEAVEWADIYMGLRIQLERHSDSAQNQKAIGDYHRRFGLNRERLQKLKKDAMIMHPGPINHGIEFSSEVMADPRNKVLAQVTNGVTIRAALLSAILGQS